MKRYTHTDLHWLLIERPGAMSARWSVDDQIGSQALVCPYYVPLEGKLGSDWGVIVNPESKRFGMLTFEHDDCGCPKGEAEDDEGWGRHRGDPNQEGDMWDVEWRHHCDEFCDEPCEWKP